MKKTGKKSSWVILAAFLGGLGSLLSQDSGGGAYRVTRDDVNAGGHSVENVGSFGQFVGSVGWIEAVPLVEDDPSPTRRLYAGMLPILDYPHTITNVVPLPVEPSGATAPKELSVGWPAPRAGARPLTNPLAASAYEVRISSLTDLNPLPFDGAGESNYETAFVVPQSLTPGAPGAAQVLPITGLTPNTSYYISIKSRDGTSNQSYMSLVSSTWTHANRPGLPHLSRSSRRERSITMEWDSNNLRLGVDALRFDAEISDDFGYNAIIAVPQTDLPVVAHTFTGLTLARPYHFRLRAYNNVGVPTSWTSPIISTEIAIGTPDAGDPPFTNHDVGEVWANWTYPDSPSGTLYTASLSTHESINPVNAPVITRLMPSDLCTDDGSGGSICSVEVNTLSPNTTYYGQVTVTPLASNTSSPESLGWTMTNVHRGLVAGAPVVHFTSATFNWTPSAASNGPNPYFYRVDVATVDLTANPGFDGEVFSSTVTNAVTTTELTGLTANTTYYARLATMNGIFIESAQGYSDYPVFVTRPETPAAGAVTGVTDESLSVAWTANGNNVALSRYRVQTTSAPAGDFNSLVSAAFDTAPGAYAHTFNGLVSNATYYFRVQTLGHAGETSPWHVFGTSMTLPTAPFALAYPAVSSTSLTLAWQPGQAPRGNRDGTVYRVDHFDGLGTPLGSANTTVLNQPYTGLTPNTTYLFQVTALSDVGWPEVSSVQSATATLAAVPVSTTPASNIFTNVTAFDIRYRWDANGNPADTDYRVQITSHPAGAFTGPGGYVTASVDLTAPSVLENTFSGLVPNTSYYFRVSGVNLNGLLSEVPTWLVQGPQATNPVGPGFRNPPFTTTPTSITLHINPNGNAGDTVYRIIDDLLPAPSTRNVTLDGNSDYTWTGLNVNSRHDYRVAALSWAGEPTAFVALSTWTRAATPPIMNVGLSSPVSIDLTLNGAGNPNGPLPASRTQYAIRAIAVGNDRDPVHAGRYLMTPGAGPDVFVLDGQSGDGGIWKTLQEWNNGVIVSSGLYAGAAYTWVSYARNGDSSDLTSPYIQTVAGSPRIGRTTSQRPNISLFIANDAVRSTYTAVQSQVTNPQNFAWTRQPLIPFYARGAFNNYFEFSQSPTPVITVSNYAGPPYRGWNGHNVGGPIHDDPVWPNAPADEWDYAGPVSAFRATAEGVWYLHLIGDNYAPAYGVTARDPLQTYEAVPSFKVHVDLTPPATAPMLLRAQRDPANPTPLTSGQTTGWTRPYFFWENPDPTPSDSISPIVGYRYLFTSDPSAMPVQSTDTVGNTNLSGFLVGADTRAHQITYDPMNPRPNGTYYFRVTALDRAGNWTNVTAPAGPAEFIYQFDADFVAPTARVEFNASVTVPQTNVSVAVSTTGVIRVVYTEEMDPTFQTPPHFQLRRVENNMGSPVAEIVPLIATVESPTVTRLQPASGSLAAGSEFILQTVVPSAPAPGITDLAGNGLEIPDVPGEPPSNGQLFKRFHTLMSPAVTNEVRSRDNVTRITFPPYVWGNDLADLAINVNATESPMAAPRLAGLIENANKSASKNFGGYGRPLAVHEFNLYDAVASRLAGRFNEPVRITMRYNDATNNGIVDESEGTRSPLRVEALSIYWLDEDTGVWVRIPGSEVDRTARTVTANVRHFSVYGLIGAPALDLSAAYAYPVPYKPGVHANGIRFANLSSVATIKIYTIAGELVNTFIEDDGDGVYTWNPVTNSSGDPLGSDVYLYVIQNDQEKKVGKILVVR